MMNKRKAATTTERTTVRTSLSPLEEKVVRMRHGLRAPESMALEHQGEGNPELMAKLEEIERRVLAAASARQNPTKSKIIGSLRAKSR